MRTCSPRALALLAVGALLVARAPRLRPRGPPDLVNGKELFVGKGTCGSCHVLARAGTKGVQGPNLDEAFGPARRDGLGEETVEGVVLRQIASVRRKSSTMPADLVTGDDARDVAAYVAAVAGQRRQGHGRAGARGAPKISNKPIAAKGGVLTIDADPTGALAFASTTATGPAGVAEVRMGNESSVQHNIALEEPGGSLIEEGKVVGQGGTSEFSAAVKTGQVHLPLHRARPRGRRHEGRAHRQVGGPAAPYATSAASSSRDPGRGRHQAGRLARAARRTSPPASRARSASRPPSPRASGRARSSRPRGRAATAHRSSAAAPARRMSRTRGQHAASSSSAWRGAALGARSRSRWPPARCRGGRSRSPRSARRSAAPPRPGRR